MKNWLDKYEYGGQAGYTDIPFNYNSAWGGQFQLGGNVMPGAVGFTYARTGSIPSNGPYAKKTKASAQTGKTVSQEDSTYQTLPEVVVNSTTDPEVEQARKSMFDFYSNRPTNLSGDIASEAVENVNIEEIPIKRLQKLNAYGLYYPSTNTIGYNNQTVTPEGYSEDPYNELQTLKHEIGHSVYESLPKNEQQIIKESIISPKEFRNRWNKGEISRSWSKYVTKPTEFYTRRNRLFDMFEIDPSQPISDEKAQEMIDFRKWAGQGIPPEEKEALLKKHPNFNKYKENFDRSANKPEIIDFINAIKNDVPTYKRVFNEVTAVPGEQAPIAQNGDKYSKNKEQVVSQLSNLPIYSPDQRYSEYQGNIKDWTSNVINTPVEVNYNSPAQGSSYYGKNPPFYDQSFPYQGTVQLDDRQFDRVQTPDRVIGHELRHAAFDGDKYIPQWLGDNLYNTARNPEGFEQGAHQDKLRERASMLIGARQNALDELGLPANAKLSEDQFNYWARQPLMTTLRTGRIPDQYNDVRETFFGAKNATDVRNLINMENLPQRKNGGMTYYQHGLDWKPKSISKDGSVIKDNRGQWAHPGEVTEIGSNRITMQGVPYPVLGVSDQGDTQMMFPEQEYKFKGKKVTEIPMAQKGKKQLPPVYVNDPNDPRLKLYNDSLSTFKKSQNPWFWEGTKVTTKQDYEKKLAEQRKFPYWSFDEDQYKKDKKKGKFKDFNDYVYDVSLANKPGSREADAHQRNVGKDFEELENPIEKILPDGRIKQYYTKYKGKLIDDQYSIYDPVTGSSSYYSLNNFMSLYNPNIKPIGHVYHAFDKPYNTGSIQVSSEDSEYVNKVLKNKSKKKKDYTNYTYGVNDTEIYKEPVQPVIYNKKKYNPNDPRLKQLQESFDRFHSSIKGKSKEEPKQPKPEPTLKKQVSNVEPIHSSLNYTPQINTIQHSNLQLPDIQMGDYDVSYYSPESKDWANRRFTSQEESDRFAQEMSQRGYPGSYGNVTQTKKLNKKSTGGWLDKYDDGGTLGEDDKYQIQRGDTLSTIAKQYNVPLATLANANQLQNPNLIKTGKELVIPKKYDRELKFEEIPTTDNKKIVIDNFSPHYDYIIEGGKTYYKTKGGKTWADISDNTNARKNLLKFIDKNNYWAGYTSGEKEELYPTTPSKVSIGIPSARDLARQMTSSTDNTFAKKPQKQLTTKTIKTPSEKQPIKKVIKQDPNFLSGVIDNLASNVTNVGKKFSDVKTQIENTVTDIKNSVESGVNNSIQTVEDLYQTGINGIKRKYATHTGEDDDIRIVDKTKQSDKPMTLAEYYNNKSVGEISAVIDVPDGSGRQFKQQVLPTSNIKFGFRNRGEYKDINTDGIEITTFNPFTKDPLPDNTSVLAIDKEGNLHTGAYKDFKGKSGYLFSKTFKNNIVDFAESGGKNEYVDGAKSGNPKYKQPKIKVLNDQGKIVDGSLNVLVKGDDKKEFYGSIQGGRVLFVNPTTKEQYLVSGSVDHIKKKFKELKGNNKYLEAYTLDNGTYSRGLSYKDKKLTASRLKSYDLENTGGGNGLYISEYKQPMNKFKEEYIQTPNVRTEKDESYKKGHKLRNEIKNIVLHHTAYTNPKTNEEEVKKQYMTPGANTSHVVIQENGKRVVYASPEQVTFHAGKSKWNNRDNVNDFSIGVEFQGDTNRSPLTQAQIESFVEYYTPIAKKYGISLKDVITHQMIAPERKPDITNKEYKRILDYMKSKGFK